MRGYDKGPRNGKDWPAPVSQDELSLGTQAATGVTLKRCTSSPPRLPESSQRKRGRKLTEQARGWGGSKQAKQHNKRSDAQQCPRGAVPKERTAPRSGAGAGLREGHGSPARPLPRSCSVLTPPVTRQPTRTGARGHVGGTDTCRGRKSESGVEFKVDILCFTSCFLICVGLPWDGGLRPKCSLSGFCTIII